MYHFLFISVKKGFTVNNKNKEFLSQITCWINQWSATSAKVNEQPCSTWRKLQRKFAAEHTIKCGSYRVRLVTSSQKCGGSTDSYQSDIRLISLYKILSYTPTWYNKFTESTAEMSLTSGKVLRMAEQNQFCVPTPLINSLSLQYLLRKIAPRESHTPGSH